MTAFTSVQTRPIDYNFLHYTKPKRQPNVIETSLGKESPFVLNVTTETYPTIFRCYLFQMSSIFNHTIVHTQANKIPVKSVQKADILDCCESNELWVVNFAARELRTIFFRRKIFWDQFWDHFSKSLVTIQVFTSETWAPTRAQKWRKIKLSRIYAIAIYEHLSLIRNSHCFWIKSVQMSFTTIQKR